MVDNRRVVRYAIRSFNYNLNAILLLRMTDVHHFSYR
jgi:hypothetical protein